MSNRTQDRALRFNEGKLEWNLVHFKSLEPLVQVLMFGAEKYAANNWMRGLNRREILASTIRHLTALLDGEECDPESGLPHIGHAQCNLMFHHFFTLYPEKEVPTKRELNNQTKSPE